MLAQRLASCRRVVSLSAPSHHVRCVHHRGFASASGRKRRTRQVSFLTDVEGDAAYFDRFVENSRVLCFQSTSPNLDRTSSGGTFFPYNKQVAFRTNCSMLVYGGDVCDKGGSDLYILRQLLSLQHRYPDRVHLLMGNRDINKMRIVPEMGADDSRDKRDQRLPYHGGCWWLAGTGLDGDPLADDMPENGTSKVPSNSPAERLRWILGKTMGSPDAFELRRNELAREEELIHTNSKATSREISDEDVVRSFRRACHPDGEVGRYLSSAKLLVKVGSALFMHGALPRPDVVDTCQEHSLWSSVDYAIPWVNDPCEEISSVDNWIECLNSFAHSQVGLWKKNALHSHDESTNRTVGVWSTIGGYNTHFDYGNLLQFGMGWLPTKKKNPTIVYSSWLNDGMPQQFYGSHCRKMGAISFENATPYAREVSKFFDAGHLQLILSGHQPHGDHPTPINMSRGTDEGKVNARFILPCDTSYSGDAHWMCSGSGEKRNSHGRGNSISGRGDTAVCEVLIDQNVDDGSISSTISHGKLSDGTRYESINLFDADKDPDTALIGTLLDRDDFVFEGSVRDDSGEEMDWWIKNKLSDGRFLVSSGKGYDVFISIAEKKHNGT